MLKMEKFFVVALLFSLTTIVAAYMLPSPEEKGEKEADIVCQQQFDENVDYSSQMLDAAVGGDIQAGMEAERLRTLKINALHLDAPEIHFMDLYLLAKVITAEAGSSWLSADWKLMVGEVLLNRVASPEFPDSIEECIYAPGQYYSQENTFFANLVPYRDCAEVALMLLEGERYINDPTVVFQANFRQGSGVALVLWDQYLGSTFLCYSNHPWLYE